MKYFRKNILKGKRTLFKKLIKNFLKGKRTLFIKLLKELFLNKLISDSQVVNINKKRRDHAVINYISNYKYGSFTEGIEKWQEKWESSPGKRILFFAPIDYSGSFFRWAESINNLTNYAVRLVTFQEHEFGYRNDLIFSGSTKNKLSSLKKIISESDLIHLKDEIGFYEALPKKLNQSNLIPFDFFKNTSKPLIYTLYGAKARRFQDEKSFRDHVNQFDAVVSMTADLAFPWINNCFYVPHSIDCKKYKYCWEDNLIIGHSPSSPKRKGTERFQEVITYAKRKIDLDYDLIENVSYEECLKRKKKISLFYDQAGWQITNLKNKMKTIGWYGNSALEAMVLGVPTMAHLDQKALINAYNLMPKDFIGEIPILNIPMIYEASSVEYITNLLINYFQKPTEDRKILSIKTRQFVEKFHSYESTSDLLINIYQKL